MAKAGARSGDRVRLLYFLVSLATVLTSGWVAADTVYNYDASGRLTGLVDASGNAARYNYDSAGNILSINRFTTGAIGIFGFTPASGYPGQQVTITGIGFSATASQNTVKFNGVTASVVSAAANQVVATIPATATSGSIAVTSPAGTATAPGTFVITAAPPPAPTVTGFTPTSGGAGDSITISGANFSAVPSQTRISFGGSYGAVTAATTTSITVTVPAGAANGPITVAVPNGTATSSGSFYFIPGGYKRANVGSTTSTVYTTNPADQAATVTISDASKIHLFTFSGTAGQRISAAILDGPSLRADVKVFAPDGSLVSGPVGSEYFYDPSGVFYAPGALLGPFVLPMSGTYTIEVVPVNGTTGSTQVAVYQVPADISSTIVAGQTINVNLDAPGQKAAFTFPYPAGTSPKAWFQFISTKSINFETLFQLINPDRTVNYSEGPELLLQPRQIWKFAGTHAISQSGSYTASLVGNQAYTVNGSLLYLQFPPAAATNISTSGTAVSTPALANGQNAVYYFDETANRSIALNAPYVMQGGGLYNSVWLTVFNPDGTELVNAPFTGTSTYYLSRTKLSQSGRYTILVSSNAQTDGTVTLSLYDVPANSSSTLSSGTPATVPIGTPGQGADFLINATQAQQTVSFNIAYTASPPSFLSGTIYNPDGTVFDSSTIVLSSSSSFIKPMKLGTQTGIYKLVLTPNHNATGSVTTTFWNVPPDTTAALTNGSSATLSISVPGQGADFTFSGTAGQNASFNIGYSLSGGGCVHGTLYNPNGTVLVQLLQSCLPSGQNSGPYALGATGTYKLVTTAGVGTGTGTVTTKLTLN